MASLPRLRFLVGRALQYTYEGLMQASALWHALRGAHPGELFKLNKAWVKALGVGTVIDVGAHRGEFASAIRAVFPAADVYSFEPIPECHDALRRRFANDARVRTFNVAVGAAAGTVAFHRSSFTKSSSVLAMDDAHKRAFPWSAGETTIDVEMRTLDDVLAGVELAPKVLLKLDVQGYEDRVLAGAARLLARTDYVTAEVSFRALYRDQPLFDQIYAQLGAAGFRYHGNLDQLTSPEDGRVLQADAFFVREG
jgi:FkbM family methyltransferase